jgi:Mn-containing catalase
MVVAGTAELDQDLSREHSEEINMAVPIGEQAWSQSAKDEELNVTTRKNSN